MSIITLNTRSLPDSAVTTAKIASDAVTDAKIADDVIGTEHLTAGEVDATALGADSVTAAKINNDIISGSTELASEPADTDEFLVSDAGTLKRMDYSHIKASSDWVKLASVNVSSNVASIEFIDGSGGADFSSTYHQLEFAIDGLEMTDDNVRTRMVLGAGGAYRTDSNHYSEVGMSVTGTSSVSHPNQTTSSMRLTSGGPDSADSGSSQNGTVTCYNFTHGNSRAMVYSVGTVNNTDSGGVGNNNLQLSTHCFEYTNGAVDRVKFLPDSGNISDGTITMYGLKA